jgi:hypothetical protein
MKKTGKAPFIRKISLGRIAASVAFLGAATTIAYVSVSRIRAKEEQERIDRQIEDIKEEIFVRQCRLDKIYCCSNRSEEACARWTEQNCREDDGTEQIACAKK